MRVFKLLAALAVIFSVSASIKAQTTVGFDPSRIDSTTQACTDFFQYSNGAWLNKTQIPAAYSRWGSFDILSENNNAILRNVLENAAKTRGAAGTDTQMIGDYYSACMDEEAIEKAGTNPIKPYINQINKIKDRSSLGRQIAAMHSMGIPVLFGFGGGADAKNSSMTIASARQGGLSLPNRDYYTKDDPKSVETRAKFVEYLTNMFRLLGDSPEKSAANARTVMTIQTRLANASRSPVELRNPEANYNKRTIAQLNEMTPNFSWADYMAARGVPPVTEIIVGQPAFFAEVNQMMTGVSIDDWKTYLRFMLVNSAAPRLSRRFVNENFSFYGTYLSGAKELQPRWRRCVGATDGALGEALGQEFVKTAFTPEAKRRMDALIDNLFAAYRERLSKLDWMSPETRQRALAKLATFKRKIGYPDTLRGYRGLKVDRKSYAENAMRSNRFEIARNLQDVGKPVDRTRWGMTPPTVNAYYSPLFNEIAFPAGILQPPFFNFSADDAVNYGAIGAVIGHEITHGFDDQGSQFDAEGNLKSWWTPDDRRKFEERAACVVKQFNEYQVQPNLNINGKLTLGENIADLGGLTMAYEAFQKSMQGKPRPANIDGFTPEQRFFLGWAQVWAGKYTEEAERTQVLGNTHSLPRWRVNGPLSNMPQFAQAFSCKTSDQMIRTETCRIW